MQSSNLKKDTSSQTIESILKLGLRSFLKDSHLNRIWILASLKLLNRSIRRVEDRSMLMKSERESKNISRLLSETLEIQFLRLLVSSLLKEFRRSFSLNCMLQLIEMKRWLRALGNHQRSLPREKH